MAVFTLDVIRCMMADLNSKYKDFMAQIDAEWDKQHPSFIPKYNPRILIDRHQDKIRYMASRARAWFINRGFSADVTSDYNNIDVTNVHPLTNKVK